VVERSHRGDRARSVLSPNVPPLTEGDREEIFRNVRDAAAQVIAAKGATNWAVGWRWSASSRRFCGTSRPSSR